MKKQSMQCVYRTGCNSPNTCEMVGHCVPHIHDYGKQPCSVGAPTPLTKYKSLVERLRATNPRSLYLESGGAFIAEAADEIVRLQNEMTKQYSIVALRGLLVEYAATLSNSLDSGCFSERSNAEEYVEQFLQWLEKRSPVEPSTDEQTLRRLLALAYSGSNLYRDDGELQDGSERPVIDYKRDSVAELERKISLRGAARLAASTLKSSAPLPQCECLIIDKEPSAYHNEKCPRFVAGKL